MGGKRLTYTIVTHAPVAGSPVAGDSESNPTSRSEAEVGTASPIHGSGRAAPRLSRLSYNHFYLIPTVALVAATIIGAWQTSSSGSPAPMEHAATTPAGRNTTAPVGRNTSNPPAGRNTVDASPLRAAADVAATASDAAAPLTASPSTDADATAKPGREPETEIAALTDAESGAAQPLPAPPPAPTAGPANREVPAETHLETPLETPLEAEAEAAAPASPTEESRSVVVRRGAILMNILVKAGVPRIEADRAIAALRPVYDPRGLQVGQRLNLTFEIAEGAGKGAKDRFAGLYFDPDPGHTIAVDLNSDSSYTATRTANSAAAAIASATGPDSPAAADGRTAAEVPAPTDDTGSPPVEPEPGTRQTASVDPAAPARQSRAETAAETPAPSRPARQARRVRVRRGATLMNILIKAGVPRIEANTAIGALRPVYDPRDLRAGQTMQLQFEVAEGAKDRFLGFEFEPDVDHTVTVALTNDGSYKAARVARALSAELVRANGPIRTSLFEAGVQAGVPIPVMIQFIQLYSFDVDFQRDIWAGDRFELMFDNFRDAQGRPVRQGEILYASLSVRGQVLRLYRYTPADGRPDYFNEQGESARKMLMRTPVDGARLSSRYGMRRHPILRYTKMHRGIDFAAPRGTPIYAAGDGTITRAGRNGAYGRYIKIRHNSTYATAYGHLKGFARGIRSGRRVRQGQVIGYVGSSGRSSGPHLHYEIIRGGRQINPLKLRMASGERLKGEELASFMATRGDMRTRFASLASNLGVARNKTDRQHACAGADTQAPKTDAADRQVC